MSAKGKLAICGFSKTLHTEWCKADLFSLNIASAFIHTSNMPRRGILLKLSYMMSRKSLFCNTNLSCLSGTGLQTPHLHHWGVFWGGWDSSGTSTVEFRLSLPLLSNVSNSLFFSKLWLETYCAESLKKCNSQGVSYFIRKNTDFDRHNNIDEVFMAQPN